MGLAGLDRLSGQAVHGLAVIDDAVSWREEQALKDARKEASNVGRN